MSKLEKLILEKIEASQLKPKSYGYFLARRSLFWALAGTSVVVGGLCAAVAFVVMGDLLDPQKRGLDEMPFDDLAWLLPLFWAILLIGFVLSAFYGISHTKRAYRHGPFRLAALSLAVSLGLGVMFSQLKIGEAIHTYLSDHFPAYHQLTYIPYAEWQRPDEGYLGGAAIAVDNEHHLKLKGFDGHEWIVDTSSADILVDGSLIEEGDVAIRGERTGPTTFKAITISPFD